METPWYELYVARYDAELKALKEYGIEYSIDEPMKQKGMLRLDLVINGDNPHFDLPDKAFRYELKAVFPDAYPWFRPGVYAYQFTMPRHQHIRGKSLCLLNRGTDEWDPTETLASLLKSQLSEVLHKGIIANLDQVKNDPREQAEPYSDYYDVVQNAPVLFDPSHIPDIGPPSEIRKIGKIRVGIPYRNILPCRMAVVKTTIGGESYSLNEEIRKLFSFTQVDGILYESPEHPPITDNAKDVLDWIKASVAKSGSKFNPPNSNVKVENGVIHYVIGISFPEELKKGEEGMGWIFLVNVSLRGRVDKKVSPICYLAKAAYVGPAISKDRIPRLQPLTTKTISICGLGALGSFIAIELARCGVGIVKLLDFDIVDPPTTVRWPLGIAAAGLEKTNMLLKFIKENYPNTKVEIMRHKFGNSSIDGQSKELNTQPSDKEAADWLTMNADLLIDATAETGVTNYLTRIAVRKSLPHIVLYATPGAWGGVVMRWIPGVTEGCWNCMRHWQNDNPGQLVPPVDHGGMVQPPGCGDVTFTGASFDLNQVWALAVRMAVSILCSGVPHGYSLMKDDWAVLRLVDSNGQPIFPEWKAQKLLRHTRCGYCEKKVS